MNDIIIQSAADRQAKMVPEAYFSGHVLQDVLVIPEGASRLLAVTVTFAPRARNVWHSHENRQVLVVTTGVGVLQAKGRPPRLLRPGDVASVPPGLVHWHGATTESLFAHISLLEGGLDTTTWMEAVDEEEYRSIADLHRVG